MKKKPEIFITHIADCVNVIEQKTKGKTWTDFLNDSDLQDIVIRRLQIIGEAGQNLEKHFKEKYPKIPWRRMWALRNILIHEYFGIDIKLVWQVVKKDIPKLKKEILKISTASKKLKA